MKSVECPPRPKMEIVIDNGIFDCIVCLLVKLGLCHQKERIQSENPQANVRYSFECTKQGLNGDYKGLCPPKMLPKTR